MPTFAGIVGPAPGRQPVSQIRCDGQISSVWRNRVKPDNGKYSALQKCQISGMTHPARAAMRGRNAIVTERWRGLRWTLRRQVGSFSPDETFAADGEVVWSWRRDRGVKLARGYRADDGGKKRRSPGRVRISRKPLRGESRDVSAVPVKSVCILLLLFAHGAAGAVGARLSLRPLMKRGQRDCIARAKTCRGNAKLCLLSSCGHPSRRHAIRGSSG